jgi:hypothetical protein
VAAENIYKSVFHEKNYQYESNAGFIKFYISCNITDFKVNIRNDEIGRILTNKEIYTSVKKPTITETIRLNRLRWFGHVQRMEGNRIPKRVLYMNLGTTRLRGRPRNRWQDEVREDGRIVGGEGWQEKST